ncbi:MAG: hypothetical protein IAF38_08080 [Bacteroidia bacterium]|nr:hypothetical protein [Bacteroidia bacterium]
MTFQKNKLFADAIVCLVLTVMFAALIFPVLNTPFSVGDDHRIIAMNAPEKMEAAYKKSLFDQTPNLAGSVLIDAQIGRFRPMGWLITKTQCVLFGDNYFSWRVWNLFILFFSVLFLSLIIGKLGGKGLGKLAILAVYVFGRNNETWWTLIPPAQNIGELFLLAGFYHWLRYRENNTAKEKYFALVLFLFSALVKESFIFCLPFVGLMDFLFINPQKKLFTREYKQGFIVFIIPFAILLSIILFSKKIYGYPYEQGIFSILGYNAWQFFFSSVFLLAPVTMFFYRNHVITRRSLVKIFILTLSWFLVQLILLKSIRMDDQHHYLVPGLLLVLVLSALSIQNIKQRSTIVSNVLVLLYFSFAIWQAKNTFVNSGYYSAQVKSFYKMTAEIKKTSPGIIVYMSHSPFAGDWLMGTSAILRNSGINSPICFSSLADSIPKWQKEFLKSRPQMKFQQLHPLELGFRSSDMEQILQKGDWIVFPDFLSKNEENPPQVGVEKYEGSNNYDYLRTKPKHFSTSYYDFSISKILKGNFSRSSVGYCAIQIE